MTLIRNITQILGEKYSIESILYLQDIDKKVTPLCHKDEVISEFKNENFDYIHVDENDVVVDVQLIDHEPTNKELRQFNIFWTNIYTQLLKEVEPYIVVMG